MSIRTKPSTDEYRSNWDRIFGKPCAACGKPTEVTGPVHEEERVFHSRCLLPVDAPLEAEVARLAADSPPSSDGWSVDDGMIVIGKARVGCDVVGYIRKPGTGE